MYTFLDIQLSQAEVEGYLLIENVIIFLHIKSIGNYVIIVYLVEDDENKLLRHSDL